MPYPTTARGLGVVFEFNMAADLVGSTSTFALSIHEAIVQVNLTRLHVDYNPNSTAMLNSKTTPRAARGCGIRH